MNIIKSYPSGLGAKRAVLTTVGVACSVRWRSARAAQWIVSERDNATTWLGGEAVTQSSATSPIPPLKNISNMLSGAVCQLVQYVNLPPDLRHHVARILHSAEVNKHSLHLVPGKHKYTARTGTTEGRKLTCRTSNARGIPCTVPRQNVTVGRYITGAPLYQGTRTING